MRKLLLLALLVLALPASANPGRDEAAFTQNVIEAAIAQTRQRVTYDGSYRRIAYPGGDVPSHIGADADM